MAVSGEAKCIECDGLGRHRWRHEDMGMNMCCSGCWYESDEGTNLGPVDGLAFMSMREVGEVLRRGKWMARRCRHCGGSGVKDPPRPSVPQVPLRRHQPA
jgi:hypothetical protein